MPSASTGRKKKRCQTTALQIRTVTLRGADSSVISQYFGFMPDIYFGCFTPNMLYNFLRTLLRRLELALWRTIEDYYSYVESFQNVGPGRRKGWSHKLIGQLFCFIAGCHFFYYQVRTMNDAAAVCAMTLCSLVFFFNALCKEQYVANVLNPIALWDWSV